jgi:hypothetical protein
MSTVQGRSQACSFSSKRSRAGAIAGVPVAIGVTRLLRALTTNALAYRRSDRTAPSTNAKEQQMFRHHHQVITGIALALALALATVAPSVASARYVPDPPPATSQPQAQPAVDLRSPDARDAANSAVRAIQGQGARSRDATNPAVRAINAQGVRVAHELAARDSLTASPPPPLVITVPRPNGFEWGDAGIGAAAGLALTMIALGGALAVSRYRGHRTRDTTPALTN